ncbi:MAG: Inner membrane protein YjdF [Phycisphaerae bacterium]|nr:Inner membrane protein YjdF [Phycisphaerae bacterium]
MADSTARRRWIALLAAAFAGELIWSAIAPADRTTWWLEVTPALLGVAALAITYPRFRFSLLVYVLVLAHATILLVGGHYTYANEPLFNWLRDRLGLHRNYFDRLGHLAQGFVPAIIIRELLVRTSPLRRGWLATLTVCACLAISACYELVEWAAAMIMGASADAFLGTQGDVWDTQKDMLMALIGALLAVALLSRLHDRAMRRSGVADAGAAPQDAISP